MRIRQIVISFLLGAVVCGVLTWIFSDRVVIKQPIQSGLSYRDSLFFNAGRRLQAQHVAQSAIEKERLVQARLKDELRTKPETDAYKAHFDTAGFRSMVDSLLAD